MSLPESFYSEWTPRLVCYFRNRWGQGSDEARDLCQDTFERFLGAYKENAGKNPAPLLYTIARNRVIDKLRNTKYSDTFEDQVHVSSSESPEEALLFREDQLKVRTALSGCTVREQEAAFLRFYEGMKVREIAVVLEVTPGTVKTLLSRVRKRVKEVCL